MIFVAIYQFIERKIAAQTAYWRAIDELSLFSQRDLFDINMSSADIPYLAEQAAREAEEKLLAQHTVRMEKLRGLAA